MKRCWCKEPHQRGTFEDLESELSSMLANNFKDLPSHLYYQFVPIRDTEIGGVIRDCGMRGKRTQLDMENDDAVNEANQENQVLMQNRRFSC